MTPPRKEDDIVIRTKPNSLYVGLAFLLTLLLCTRSRGGSYVHLRPLTEGMGSRAGTRSMAGSLSDVAPLRPMAEEL